MKLNVNHHYHGSVVAIEGRFLGALKGGEVKEAFNALKEAGKTQVVVDLSKADFMDSTAIGTLIGCLTTMRRAGGDVRLAGMEKRIKNLFLLTRLLGPVFESYETVEDALASYEDHPAPTTSPDA